MKNIIMTIALAVLSFVGKTAAQTTRIATDPYAKMYVDGMLVSNSAYETKIKKGQCVNVRVERTGYMTAHQTICNNGDLKKNYTISLEKDEAFESSMTTDIANRDITLDSKRTPEETWLIISQILQDNFDVIEAMDENTGYMRTAWTVHNFNGSTVRTRAIVKLSSASPLAFRIKMQTEIAPAGSSVKEDENFKPWGRLLRVFEPIVSEMQGRLKPALLTKSKNS